MQNFYKVSQANNNEKVPSFAMRLEGTLIQIKLPVPWDDDRPRDPTMPQGSPVSWGEKAYLLLCPVPIQHP